MLFLNFVKNGSCYEADGVGYSSTLYGRCEFGADGGRSLCRLHKRPTPQGGYDDSSVNWVNGTHPIIRGVLAGDNYCCASEKVLARDREFLDACCTMDIPGFAYVTPRGLPSVDKYGNGTIMGLRALGRGYCYITLIREGFRMRAARLLGPYPLVAELLTILRLCGKYEAGAVLQYGGKGVVHCAVSPGLHSVRDIVEELLGYVQLFPSIRVGGKIEECNSCRAVVDMDDHLCTASVLDPVMKPGKGFCGTCGFVVKLEGHETRCRVQVSIDPAAKLLGDAVHALDVKRAVVRFGGDCKFTVVAQGYMHSESQARWLRDFHPECVVTGHNDHTIADVFEARYIRHFRIEYLLWLAEQLGAPRVELLGYCFDVTKWLSYAAGYDYGGYNPASVVELFHDCYGCKTSRWLRFSYHHMLMHVWVFKLFGLVGLFVAFIYPFIY